MSDLFQTDAGISVPTVTVGQMREVDRIAVDGTVVDWSARAETWETAQQSWQHSHWRQIRSGASPASSRQSWSRKRIPSSFCGVGRSRLARGVSMSSVRREGLAELGECR